MDRIRIDDLEVRFRVGVPDDERAVPQRLLISAELETDVSTAAESDDLGSTIDYFAVSQRILQFGEGRSWKLIETLATDLAETIRTEFSPTRVTVLVKKFILPQARFVSVQITRPE